jgi:hypothetical protein
VGERDRVRGVTATREQQFFTAETPRRRDRNEEH